MSSIVNTLTDFFYVQLKDLKVTFTRSEHTSEPKHTCPSDFQDKVEVLGSAMLNTTMSSVYLKTFSCRHDCCHGLYLRLKTLSLHSGVFANLENTEHWYTTVLF